MRTTTLALALALAAGCSRPAMQAASVVVPSPPDPASSRLATGSEAIAYGDGPIDVRPAPDHRGPKWTRDDPEFAYPWITAGDRLIVLDDDRPGERPDRPVRVRLETCGACAETGADQVGHVYMVARKDLRPRR